ncbi:50S ribosomal protein L25/general stress protein Ctc [Peribacillus sp. B-H-3]|uniref:50S ribosomal protein L25/general stress protein Ctc n=1 Tax=Peribacillus sp. B-H-3 TaxID=3400420 RepID=UPI003B01CA65
MSNVLAAKEREKTNLKHLRDSGDIPAIVYGNKNTSTAISVSNGDFQRVIKEVGRNGIISLDVQGKKHDVMLSDFQKDPLKNEIYHADFLIVNMSEERQAQVRINLVGDSKGVKDGGVLQQSIHEVTVTAKPNDIPESFNVDVTNLDVGDTVTIADVKNANGITIDQDEEEVIASVLAPRQEEEISTGEQQDGGTPVNEEGRETSPSSES